MKSVLEACTPRERIIKGSFNPEVFTASLMPVIDFYRTGRSTIDKMGQTKTTALERMIKFFHDGQDDVQILTI